MAENLESGFEIGRIPLGDYRVVDLLWRTSSLPLFWKKTTPNEQKMGGKNRKKEILVLAWRGSRLSIGVSPCPDHGGERLVISEMDTVVLSLHLSSMDSDGEILTGDLRL